MLLERFRELSQGLVAKILLALITVPFALFGVDYYFRNGGGGDAVAHVDGTPVSQKEFSDAVRNRLTELRNMLGQNAPDIAQLNSPQLRQAVLNQLVDQTVVETRAHAVGLVASDAMVAERIGSMEAFKEDGKFSQKRYEQLLAANGLTPTGYERSVRTELSLQVFQQGIQGSAVVPQVAVAAWARLSNQSREVSVATFGAEAFLDKVKVEDKDLHAWYDAHADNYKVPERVQLQYLVLNPEVLGKDIQVAPDEIAAAYEQQSKGGRFNTPEERRAAHILISVAATAPEAERKAAKAKAEQVLAEVKAHPDQFARLAEKYSQDPGSAKQGGDLGFFGRGAMVKPFEDAAFALKKGELSEVVQSDFGYHIIRLTEIKDQHSKSLEEASPELLRELRTQKAAKKFAEAADSFSNLVFEQSGSLKPAADALKLEIQQSGWISRTGAGADSVLANPKVLQAAFASDVVRDKRNTAAIEAGPNVLVAARATAYEAAVPKPFAEVADSIRQQLVRTQAAQLAVKAGQDALAALQAGKPVAGLSFGEAKSATRATAAAAALPPALVDPAFKAPTAALPAYAGAELSGNGYGIVRISKVEDGKADDEATRKQAEQTLRRSLEQGELNAVLASLRKSASISISKTALGQTTAQPGGGDQ
ncbi:MAG: SurA N-terminal domain-containing protein [Pseudomonadota bacterium]|nr:SurA N-terminal domain-containing protein [Pseudomonadota bacterium]